MMKLHSRISKPNRGMLHLEDTSSFPMAVQVDVRLQLGFDMVARHTGGSLFADNTDFCRRIRVSSRVSHTA